MENKITEIIGKLIDFARQFKTYLALAAFIILAGMVLIVYLFPPGSFSGVANALGTLSPEQLIYLALAFMVLFLIVLVLLLVFSFVDKGNQPQPRRPGGGQRPRRNDTTADGTWLERHRHTLLLLGVLGIVVGAIVAGAIYFPKKKTIRSVAIIPFTNVNGDPNVEHFCDGIAELITNSLTRLRTPNLTIMARDSVRNFRGRTDARQIGLDLHVDAVLVGKLTKTGDQLFISTWLVDVRDNKELWSDIKDYKMSEFLDMQKKLATNVSDQLGLLLNSEQKQDLVRASTSNPTALELYWKGRTSADLNTEAGLKEAINYYDQAIQLDPNFARAYAGKATAYFGLSDFALPAREAMSRALEASVKAVAIDSSLAEAHATLGMVKFYYDWDWAGAESEFKRAIELEPSYVTARQFYADYLTAMQRHDEAIAEVQAIQRLDPRSPFIYVELGRNYLYARKYADAIGFFKSAVNKDPNSWIPHYHLGQAYALQKDHANAIAELERAADIDKGSDIMSMLARVYAASGVPENREKAKQLLTELERKVPPEYVSSYDLAMIYVALGQTDKAFEFFRKAYAEKSDGLVLLKANPWVDGIRADQRFVSLLRDLRFPIN